MMEGYEIEFSSIQKETQKAMLLGHDGRVAWIPKSCFLHTDFETGTATIKDGFEISWKSNSGNAGYNNSDYIPTTAESRKIIVTEANRSDLWEYM